MVVAQGYVFEDNGTGWAMLLSQMNRTIRMLARVHEIRGELHQAERLRGVEHELRLFRQQGKALTRQSRQRASEMDFEEISEARHRKAGREAGWGR